MIKRFVETSFRRLHIISQKQNALSVDKVAWIARIHSQKIQ